MMPIHIPQCVCEGLHNLFSNTSDLWVLKYHTILIKSRTSFLSFCFRFFGLFIRDGSVCIANLRWLWNMSSNTFSLGTWIVGEVEFCTVLTVYFTNDPNVLVTWATFRLISVSSRHTLSLPTYTLSNSHSWVMLGFIFSRNRVPNVLSGESSDIIRHGSSILQYTDMLTRAMVP